MPLKVCLVVALLSVTGLATAESIRTTDTPSPRRTPSAPCPLVTYAITRIPAIDSYGSIAGDFDGDGGDDVVLFQDTNRPAVILWSDGHQAFESPKMAMFLPPDVTPSILKDIDGDGRVEVISQPTLHSIRVSRIQRDGSRETVTEQSIASDTYFISNLALGDFLGNGTIQIAVALNTPQSRRLQVFDLRSNGVPLMDVPLTDSIGFDLMTVDANHDGVDDLLVTGQGVRTGYQHDFGPGKDGYLSYFISTGTSFVENRFYKSAEGLRSGQVGDFAGAGSQDVIVVEPPGLMVLYTDALGAVLRKQQITSAVVYYAKVADLNGDGKDDLALLGYRGLLQTYFGRPEGLVSGPSYPTDEASTYTFSMVRTSPYSRPALLITQRYSQEALLFSPACAEVRHRSVHH